MRTLPIVNTTYVTSLARQLSSEAQTIEQATQWAWWLLEKVTNASITTLIARPRQLTHVEKQCLDLWIKQICTKHKPITYIFGSVAFGPLEITVEAPLLIPRTETEFWVNTIATEYQKAEKKPLNILDIGTGSGCIALLLAKITHAHVTGVDISPQAIALAQRNASLNAITHTNFIQSDLFTSLNNTQIFDCIVSNPPYIALDKSAKLEKSVLQWEDPAALFSKKDGLAHIERIIAQAPTYLRCRCSDPSLPLKQLCIEIDPNQADKVVQMMMYHGYNNVVVMQDQYQRDRVVCASKGCFCQNNHKSHTQL